MLIECANCGAPLKTEPNRDTFKCGYCDSINRVANVRKITEQEPEGWRPPAKWTPPAHMPARSVPLAYHTGRKATLSHWYLLGAFALVGIASMAVFAALGGRQVVTAEDGYCPVTFAALPAGTHSCRCGGPDSHSIWGSQIYTADSSICGAAVHAGAISGAGGEVRVASAPGCAGYAGSFQNGVQTQPWGSYGASFYFPGHGDGQCVTSVKRGNCPQQFTSIAGTLGSQEYSCECGASQMNGAIWGSGIYTADSSPCKAAVHAGAIPNTGGRITIKAAPGCPSYLGSVRNGITTGAWGSYQQSFYFPGHGNGACAQ